MWVKHSQRNCFWRVFGLEWAFRELTRNWRHIDGATVSVWCLLAGLTTKLSSTKLSHVFFNGWLQHERDWNEDSTSHAFSISLYIFDVAIPGNNIMKQGYIKLLNSVNNPGIVPGAYKNSSSSPANSIVGTATMSYIISLIMGIQCLGLTDSPVWGS